MLKHIFALAAALTAAVSLSGCAGLSQVSTEGLGLPSGSDPPVNCEAAARVRAAAAKVRAAALVAERLADAACPLEGPAASMPRDSPALPSP